MSVLCIILKKFPLLEDRFVSWITVAKLIIISERIFLEFLFLLSKEARNLVRLVVTTTTTIVLSLHLIRTEQVVDI